MPMLYFGGSFNPIHHGHLVCARAVAESCGHDQVVLVPTAQPPHKPFGPDLAPPADRSKMCQLAIVGSQRFAVDEIEVNRPGPSYTIDTVRELRRRGSGAVHWLIGADMLLFLPNWRQPLDLLNEVHFVVMARPGWTIDWNALPTEYRHLQANVVQAPMIDISASQIRRRVASGLSIDYLTPDPVCRYIHHHGLYR